MLGSEALLDRRMRSATRIPPRRADWVRVLHAILNTPTTAAQIDDDRVPFGQAFAPFIEYAHRRLIAGAGLARSVLSPAALAALEGELLDHLGLIASLALGRVFYDFRFALAPLSAFEELWVQQSRSTRIYRQFVDHLLRGGWQDVFERYPVLARLMVQSVEQAIENSSRLCRRILADLPRLRRHFGELTLPIASVSANLSDRHNGGQSVACLTFANGRQLIYKPRSVMPEIFFNRVLRWTNRRGLTLPLRTVSALDRGAYGWMEYVPHHDCADALEVSQFYWRAGALLALLHACGVSDIHCENLIACGDHPVVVDLETLLAERRGSVLGTGLLPSPFTARESAADASALGASAVQDSGLRFPMWMHANTDQMILVDGSPRETAQHRVRLNGALVQATDFVRELKAGFREAYACLLVHRIKLRSEPWLERLRLFDLRILVRDSATYGRMHLHLLYPEHLEDGRDRSIELEWLARPLCIRAKASRGRVAIYQHERSAMERLDLPLFTTKMWHGMRHDPATQEARAFGSVRDAKALRRRLAQLSERDCRRQLAAITRSLKAAAGMR